MSPWVVSHGLIVTLNRGNITVNDGKDTAAHHFVYDRTNLLFFIEFILN
jgi:hypothetical protein